MSHDEMEELETWVLVAGTGQRDEPLPKPQQLAAEAVGVPIHVSDNQER